jgi:phosphatidylserine/phosphatidylglycerophosphate/cardiolipin synthase-like enzyme
MRRHVESDGLAVNAVAGTHVVFFGIDLAAAVRSKCRGFAFKRTDHSDGEVIWLKGMKTFKSTVPHPAPNEQFSTRQHPIQSFQWADYSAHPGRAYTYEVVALYGDPSGLTADRSVTIEISTEAEEGPTHSAYFNRGAVASQEYARRFQNKMPAEMGQGAYDWLSRGLLEALLRFLGRASSGWSIHGAVYEFQWPAALAALKAAHARGAKVKVLYDDREAYTKGKPTGPWKKNRAAVAAAKIKTLCEGRKNCRLMHNKFFILSKHGTPIAVWTGSTNLTENGIFGHLNAGHIIENEAVAAEYMAYWERLGDDPDIDEVYRDANVAASPTPPVPWSAETTCVFSPRGKDLDALQWYTQIADDAQGGLFMTFAFGMHPDFTVVYAQDDDVLKMALLDKEYRSPSTREADEAALKAIRKRTNVVVAVGNRIVTNAFDRWLAERDRVVKEVNVRWVHTKFMLAAPFSATPVVVTGSANFSPPSCHTNDENMLVIQGDKRIADIYFGEFMRLYTHYAFREAVKWAMERKEFGKPDQWKPNYLIENDSWMADYFNVADTSGRYVRRRYFAGPISV